MALKASVTSLMGSGRYPNENNERRKKEFFVFFLDMREMGVLSPFLFQLHSKKNGYVESN